MFTRPKSLRRAAARVFEPLAALPQIAPHLNLGARVLSVTRQGFDKMKTTGRSDAPFVLSVRRADGQTIQLSRLTWGA